MPRWCRFQRRSANLSEPVEANTPVDAGRADRQELRRILLDALPPGILQWDAPVERLEQLKPQRAERTERAVVVHFKGGRPPFRATLAVGADGIHSAVRSYLVMLQGRPVSRMCLSSIRPQ
jgi:2-polyprenyl-6-methoxyphenol hydroxylase-like FAD-dependent oxidoreductase